MKRLFGIAICIVGIMAASVVVHGGEGAQMKCSDEACGYETFVRFGGGMMHGLITGYCVDCKKFVYLSWVYENSRSVDPNAKPTPKPQPIAKIWDARTGMFLEIYACPDCEGAFAKINNFKDVKHCPSCNKPSFSIDTSKPKMMID